MTGTFSTKLFRISRNDLLVSPTHSLALFDLTVKVRSIMRHKMCINTVDMHAPSGGLSLQTFI